MSTPLPTPTEAPEPQKELPMSSDTVITPPGQATVVGHGNGHNHDSALHLLAGEHRVSAQLAVDGRFTDRNHADTLKTISDLQFRNAEQFASVLNAVKDEAGRTRELMLSERNLDMRFANLRLEVLNKV